MDYTARQQADASGKPYVEIEWSESPEINDSTVLPFVEADAMLRAANEKERSLEGYYKTKLHIYYTDQNGEPGEYRDLRFDIGTETNGIIEHIEESVTAFTDENERNGIRDMLEILNAALEDKKTQNETTDNEAVPRFEANMSFAKQVDAVLSGVDTTSTHLRVMSTPLILRQLGAQNLPVLMTAKHLKNIVAESGSDNGVNYHNIDVDIIKNLPELLSDPALVMDSLTRDDSVVIVTSISDSENRPIIGAIKFDGRGNINDVEIDANILTSTYGRNNFNEFIKRNINANTVLYWDKEKSQELIKTPGLQLPDNLNSLDSNTIIRKAKAFVNRSEEKNEDFNKNSTNPLMRVGDFYVKRRANTNDNANIESRQDEQAQQAGQVEQTLKDENTKKSNLYYSINEDAARRAKQANSFDDYIDGSATAEYQRYVDEAKNIADIQKAQVEPIYHEKIDRLLDAYARNLARNMNARFDIDSRVPSVMISGAGNFPVRQKEEQNVAREKNWEEWKRISEILDKIRTIGKGGIQSSEPNALEKLEKKVAELEKSQETMKQVNAYYRKNKTLDNCPYLPKEQLDELKAEMAKSWHGTVPFQSFALSNNNTEIKRIKARIEELRETKNGRYVGWEFDGGKVEANSKDMRLQIFFDEKPNSEKRAELKKAGFRWSPTVGAWQRQLNDNAIYAANDIKCVQPISGERPTDLQRRVRAEQEILEEARKAAHNAGLPFSDKFHEGEEDFNPNVYDGSMSVEDYNLMREMVAADEIKAAATEQGKKPIVVNFYAGPGAGKTTAALELTAELKKAGVNVEYVSEYAKELVLENKTELLRDQRHVTDEQFHRLDRLRDSVDVIVTDSSVLLGVVYGGDRIDNVYRGQLRSYYDSFNNIDMHIERKTEYQTEGRVQSEQEAKELDAAISQMLQEQNISCNDYMSDAIHETVELVKQAQQVGQAQQAKNTKEKYGKFKEGITYYEIWWSAERDIKKYYVDYFQIVNGNVDKTNDFFGAISLENTYEKVKLTNEGKTLIELSEGEYQEIMSLRDSLQQAQEAQQAEQVEQFGQVEIDDMGYYDLQHEIEADYYYGAIDETTGSSQENIQNR